MANSSSNVAESTLYRMIIGKVSSWTDLNKPCVQMMNWWIRSTQENCNINEMPGVHKNRNKILSVKSLPYEKHVHKPHHFPLRVAEQKYKTEQRACRSISSSS